MHVTRKVIKEAFSKSEDNLNSCWELLIDIKNSSITENEFIGRFITFQDKLALTIFNLQAIREQIISEEKAYVKNKNKYKFEWFKAKMRLLASFKEGIDRAVTIAKALGDAYAYFFYQFDRDLLSEHLSHQRIINHTSGIGERGKLEFIRNVKQFDGCFTLLHGITNILRYGDFSFIDLKQFRILYIGELKTSKVDNKTLNANLSIIKRQEIPNEAIKNTELEKTRKGRQLLGIANFLNGKSNIDEEIRKDVIQKTYAEELDSLVKDSKFNSISIIQVSSGLAFACVKYRPKSLYNKIFKTNAKNVVKEDSYVTGIMQKLMKKESTRNSIIFGSLLYDKDNLDKSMPGTIPIFWQSISNGVLRQIYFLDSYVLPLFNPIHLINDIEDFGFEVESKYSFASKKVNLRNDSIRKTVQRFDLFIFYIINHLFTEATIIDVVKEIGGYKPKYATTQITIKLQQHLDIFLRKAVKDLTPSLSS